MRGLWTCASIAAFLFGFPRTTAGDNCGARVCEESALCSSPGVLECSDWNDGSTDGWSVSANWPVGIVAGVGLNGTAGWHQRVDAGQHDSKFFDKRLNPDVVGYGPLHARLYVKFSPGFIFRQPCGLNKMFYLESNSETTTFWRVLLGIREANRLGGTYATLPNTVGIFGFDYIGHLPAGGAVPNQPGDNPVLVYPDRWYCVEIMAHWKSRAENTVKIWVDGTLQMTRQNFDDGVWTPAHRFNNMQDSSYFGGSGPTCAAPQTQSIYKDNHVIATRYIGPIGNASPPADTQPPGSSADLQATPISSSEVSLSWTAAVDNVQVAGYKVSRNGTQVGTSTVPSFTDQGLQAATTYTYTVSAFDQAGNSGAWSTPASATTLPESSGSGTTVVIAPQADTFINADSNNYSGSASLNTYTWPDNKVINAILMKFDLSQIPAGAVVQDATLNLYLIESDSSSDATYRVTAHKVVNKRPDLGRATGAVYDGVNGWTPNPCCHNNLPLAQSDISTPHDTVLVDKASGFKSWKLATLVQDWASEPSGNYGLLLNSDDTKAMDRYRFFASSEHADASRRPMLRVTYRLRPAAPEGLKLGQ